MQRSNSINDDGLKWFLQLRIEQLTSTILVVVARSSITGRTKV